ncbi:uncharacterized protein LOC141910230 [Tubulanus polymorphus]|uniref:uncharacterized protein LOC141910230 n=1 Tax=Tubulanus polymorphus TaxID=672921 RepID=UPI003DA45195
MKLGCGLKACSPQKNVLVCNIAPRKVRQVSECRVRNLHWIVPTTSTQNINCGDRNVCSYNALLYPVTCSCWCDRVFVSSVKPYVNRDDSCSLNCTKVRTDESVTQQFDGIDSKLEMKDLKASCMTPDTSPTTPAPTTLVPTSTTTHNSKITSTPSTRTPAPSAPHPDESNGRQKFVICKIHC